MINSIAGNTNASIPTTKFNLPAGNSDYLANPIFKLSDLNTDILQLTKNGQYIEVDGKRHYVKTVYDNDPTVISIVPFKKEVVEIDGKEYEVKTVSDPLACDKTKKVVKIDGKEYNVRGNQNNNVPYMACDI